MVAHTGEPDSEIRIFRHVIGIPRAGSLERMPAEMIGRAAERQDEPVASEPRKHGCEQRRVFECEHA